VGTIVSAGVTSKIPSTRPPPSVRETPMGIIIMTTGIIIMTTNTPPIPVGVPLTAVIIIMTP
jgi:hypothetical protein